MPHDNEPNSALDPIFSSSPLFEEEFNLAHYYLFDRLHEGLGEKTAVRFGARHYSYADIADRACAFSICLRRADIRRGERVLIVLPDIPTFVWVFFGVLARGAV